MRPYSLAAAALLAVSPAVPLAAPLAAQAPKVTKSAPADAGGATSGAASGAFVVRLGADTLAVERYTRRGNRVEGDVVNRAPNVRVTHYVADLDAAGRPTRIQYGSRRPDGGLLPNTAKGVTLTYRGDSVWAEVLTAADTTSRLAAAVPAGTVPSIANSYAMYEMVLMQLRATKRPDGAINTWAPGAQSASTLKVSFDGNRATMDYFGDPVAITTDATGRILAVDGTRSTNKVLVERIASVDIPAVASAFAARGPLGPASPRDTVRATAGAAQLWIDYGRPSVRGRTVWGGLLVPLDAVWRTGANAATQLSTSADLVVGGVAVPAGTYTLWTWPTAQGYQLVINRETGQWGTDYKAGQDLARVPLTATPLAQPVEQFTFAIDVAANGGTIRMSWGNQQLSVPFVVKP